MFGFLATWLIGTAVCHEMDNYAEELNMKCYGMYNDLRRIDGVTDIVIHDSCTISFRLNGTAMRIVKGGDNWVMWGLNDDTVISILETMATSTHKRRCRGRKKIVIK